MADIGMVGKILWEDYYKIAWVNILTGEYQFVKILDTDEEKISMSTLGWSFQRGLFPKRISNSISAVPPRSIFSTRFSVSASV